MDKLNEIYKCGECGNVVEVVGEGRGSLVCCGQPMTRMAENISDAAKEKHVPVVSIEGDLVKVKVGEAPHPMTEEHLIEWIELVCEKRVSRVYLSASEKPEAVFRKECESFSVRAFCNLHGLWKS